MKVSKVGLDRGCTELLLGQNVQLSPTEGHTCIQGLLSISFWPSLHPPLSLGVITGFTPHSDTYRAAYSLPTFKSALFGTRLALLTTAKCIWEFQRWAHQYNIDKEDRYTVEPPNNGHVGTRQFVLYREFFFYCVLYLECPIIPL